MDDIADYYIDSLWDAEEEWVYQSPITKENPNRLDNDLERIKRSYGKLRRKARKQPRPKYRAGKPKKNFGNFLIHPGQMVHGIGEDK